MGSLFSSFNVGVQALRAFQSALDIAQNNVSNASTPGYAKQTPVLESQAFQPLNGLPGGVLAGQPRSARDEYLEQAVRYQAALQGSFTAQSQTLSSIETSFDVSGQTGILGAINKLTQSFSAWSATPDSPTARQDVLAKAQSVVLSFRQTAASLTQAAQSVDRQIGSTVEQINALTEQIRHYNTQRSSGGASDAGLDARLHASLETLSGLAGITARFEDDGSVTVLLGGQTPLVIGAHQTLLEASTNAAGATILDPNGVDLSDQVSGGTLGGLISVRNGTLASLLGDGAQPGSLNVFAKQVADSVNQLLTAGAIDAGPPVVPGVPLFTYTSAATAASSLALAPGITASTLAGVDLGLPIVANGTATKLAELGDAFVAAYTSIATFVGREAADSQNGQDTATQALAQARGFRSQVSGVSLDEEALRVLELQRGYQAASKLITVIDSLADTLMGMVR